MPLSHSALVLVLQHILYICATLYICEPLYSVYIVFSVYTVYSVFTCTVHSQCVQPTPIPIMKPLHCTQTDTLPDSLTESRLTEFLPILR